MEVQDYSASIYSEAKSEYTQQLVLNFQPVLLRFFLDRFTEVKTLPSVSSKSKSSLSEFQDSLSQIPEWNIDKVHSETSKLIEIIQCDYIEDLITAVFIAHTKILSAIRLNPKPRRKINITVPKPDHFTHRAMSECSRFLWSNVYLFDDTVPSVDRQKNMNEVNHLLEKGILQAIRNLLPVKSILRDSLQEEDDDAIQVSSQNNAAELPTTPSSFEAPTLFETPELSEEPELSEASSLPEVSSLPETFNNMETTETHDEKKIEIHKPSKMVDVTKSPETLVIDTERSVGFTGYDTVFGTTGDAEMKPMNEELEDEFKIIGDLEEIDAIDIEDLNKENITNTPLAADDYETL